VQTKKALRDYQNTALVPTKEADWQAIGRKKPGAVSRPGAFSDLA
jgi:hypothetical protein